MKELDMKLEYLGYKNGIKIPNLGKNYIQLLQLICNLTLDDLEPLEPITLEKVVNDTMLFYKKYFNLHDVKFITEESIQNINSDISKQKIEVLQAYRVYYEMMKKISPFEIPLKLVDGHSMIGETKKPLMIMPKEYIPSDLEIVVPFSCIELGNELTVLSSSTYAHEIAHTQLESNPGYTKNYLNKELISIFIEKVSAFESDQTGKVLLLSERRRFMYIASLIKYLMFDEKSKILNESQRLEYMSYIYSTLLTEKLFDMYIRERKQKNRDKYISDIQDVFDGKIQVEDIIEKRNININQGRDISLIQRHI